ncbi:MAG: NAD(P)/FAD-dependent oxidoreductase [Rhizobiaceae bacterium]
MPATNCLIVGGGQTAVSAAAKLREFDSAAAITIVSAEKVLPYQRPPLSKAYLSGELPLERLYLRPADWYDEHRIDVKLATQAVSIDRAKKTVLLDSGDSLPFDKLLLATGSVPRRLPDEMVENLEGVFTLRESIDSDAIRPFLKEGNRLVVIGGGYVGLEAAAIARKLGLSVTVLEIAERILHRVASRETSDYFRDLHIRNGVDIRESSGFRYFERIGRKLTSVNSSNGEALLADVALVGIGVVPNEEIARQAGLNVGNGITVDEFCRTSDPAIFAAGDCASFPFKGSMVRLESVPHAIHHAESAAENMLGGSAPYIATPWFWSDQYDVKLQIAGLNLGYNATAVRLGKREGAQSVWYYRDDELIAVDAMNDAPSFMIARRIIEAGKSVPKEVVADLSINLKEWV